VYAQISSGSVYGVEGRLITVETDISNGLPQVSIVGLPDSAVRESIERVRSAIKNCGFTFPLQRITVNLAPADLRKEGSAFDLAIATGILAASGQIIITSLNQTLVLGELALSGEIRPVPGVLAMVEQARINGLTSVLLPVSNAAEAAFLEDIQVQAITHLQQLAALGALPPSDIAASEQQSQSSSSFSSSHLADTANLSLPYPILALSENNDCSVHRLTPNVEAITTSSTNIDFGDVLGQHHAKRALLIAAAGRHNFLLSGPPGTGKTMLAKRLPGILPPLTEHEALQITKVYSAAGQLPYGITTLVSERPFRSPHHTITSAGLVGGGSIPRPGEATLAHLGVLFLDEVPEFSKKALEALRQPLEDHEITISRSRAVFHFPAHFILTASMNPCPCGYFGHETVHNRCACSQAQINRYRAKLSGPLLDRIDMQIEVARPYSSKEDAQKIKPGMNSTDMRSLVLAAHERQVARLKKGDLPYHRLSGAALDQTIQLTAEAELLLQTALESLGISMRARDRILKLARTIADLEQSAQVAAQHIAEAIGYRSLDRFAATEH